MTSIISFDRLQDSQQALLLALLSTGVSRTELTEALQSGSEQEWHERLNRHRRDASPKNLRILAAARGASPLTTGGIGRGAEVVLSGERSGKKRRYNGCLARVVRYPRAGGWMTVRPLHTATCSTSDTNTGSTLCGAGDIKWRKGGCKVEAKQLTLLGLSDNSLSHIVGYIGHGVLNDEEQQQQEEESDSDSDTSTSTSSSSNGMLWLVDAARVHLQIASVCRHLLQFATNSMRDSLGYIDANFDGLREEQIVPCVLWMCKYRLRVGRVRMRIDLADVPLMCQLLQQCDTEKVTYVQSRIDDVSSMIRKAWVAKFSRGYNEVVVDLVGGGAHPRLDRMAADLGVPCRDTCWKELHDVIAEQCPNVSHLNISVKVPANEGARDYWRSHHFSPALFSMSSIRTLELSCNFCAEGMVFSVKLDSCFVDAYTSGLHNVESLDLRFSTSHGQAVCGQRFHIHSPSLRALNVERLPKGVWVSCNCPKLEQFVCNGNSYGNGSRPERVTWEQMPADVIHTGTVNMVGLEVPDGCECTLRGFDRFHDWRSNPNGFDVRFDAPHLLAARFWTYPDDSSAAAEADV